MTLMNSTISYAAFDGPTLVSRGDLKTVLGAIKDLPEPGPGGQVLIFENETGKQVDFDLRGSLEEVLERIQPSAPKQGPGRPRLGVVSAEVTLLPRHWEWLEKQPNRASGTLRRLVDAAMRNPTEEEQTKSALEAASKFLWSMAGELPNFEEATRQLFALRFEPMFQLAADWPKDIRQQLEWMLRGIPARP